MKRLFDQGQRSIGQERLLGVAMLVAGLIIAGVSATRMGSDGPLHAQTTPPAAAPSERDQPAESMPGGTRPTTPPPEPARPQNAPQNNDGSTTGKSPFAPTSGDRPPVTGTPLPPAPAEKTAPPVQGK